jgi:hypothetical protein
MESVLPPDLGRASCRRTVASRAMPELTAVRRRDADIDGVGLRCWSAGKPGRRRFVDPEGIRMPAPFALERSSRTCVRNVSFLLLPSPHDRLKRAESPCCGGQLWMS